MPQDFHGSMNRLNKELQETIDDIEHSPNEVTKSNKIIDRKEKLKDTYFIIKWVLESVSKEEDDSLFETAQEAHRLLGIFSFYVKCYASEVDEKESKEKSCAFPPEISDRFDPCALLSLTNDWIAKEIFGAIPNQSNLRAIWDNAPLVVDKEKSSISRQSEDKGIDLPLPPSCRP